MNEKELKREHSKETVCSVSYKHIYQCQAKVADTEIPCRVTENRAEATIDKSELEVRRKSASRELGRYEEG